VGGGKMGSALLRGWISKGVKTEDIYVVDTSEEVAAELMDDLSVRVVASHKTIDPKFLPDIVVFAVKPQELNIIIGEYKYLGALGAVILSIAAGKTISFFEKHFGKETPIIRTMPNTPASIGRGITAACPNQHVTKDQRNDCETLLQSIGEIVWISDESHIDAVTAVSGSGPAYVFLLIECITAAGTMNGLPYNIAEKLALSTVAGSGELALLSKKSSEILRREVTSTGGTTAAALDILMDEKGLKYLMCQAIEAATKRSRELAD
tara:strand:+ start:255 stop:1049 length:795 start_codon:yes stop_codon:yes gene_type:complete